MQKQLHHKWTILGIFLFLTKKVKVWTIIKNNEENRNTCLSYDKLQPNMKKGLFSTHIFSTKSKIFSFHHQHFCFCFFEVHGDHHRKQRPWPSNIRFSKLFKNLFFFKITNCVTVLKYFCFCLKSSVDLACLWKELPEILN